MSKPAKKSARERLVERFAHWNTNVYSHVRKREMAAFLRDLRKHERELAERVIALKLHCTCRTDNKACPRSAAIRSAILKRSAAPKAHGPRAAKRGGR